MSLLTFIATKFFFVSFTYLFRHFLQSTTTCYAYLCARNERIQIRIGTKNYNTKYETISKENGKRYSNCTVYYNCVWLNADLTQSELLLLLQSSSFSHLNLFSFFLFPTVSNSFTLLNSIRSFVLQMNVVILEAIY